MLPPTLASIPEVKEEYPGSCLIERTARLPQFIELGPPDLCNIHKYSANAKRENEIGTFYISPVLIPPILLLLQHIYRILLI